MFFPIIKSVPGKGQNTPKSYFRGPKIPPEVRGGHETCSTICGTSVQAILDQKNLTGLAGRVRVRVGHETCSTICGTPVQAILDQKNLTGLGGGVREGQNNALVHMAH